MTIRNYFMQYNEFSLRHSNVFVHSEDESLINKFKRKWKLPLFAYNQLNRFRK